MSDTVVVVRAPSIVTVVRDPGVVTVAAAGVQGIRGQQGAPGPPGGTGFEYVQSSPAATWIISHNLARKVHVSLFDADGIVIHADVVHGSLNQTTVTFAAPKTGSAVLS